MAQRHPTLGGMVRARPVSAARYAVQTLAAPPAPPAPEEPLTLYGGADWDTTNRLGSVVGGGYRGNTAGFTVAVLVQIDTQVNQGKLLDYLDGSGKGWDFFQDTATSLVFRGGNAAGNAFVSSPQYLPATDLGKVQLLVGVHTGVSGVVDLWASKTRVGAGTVTTGYSLPSTSLQQVVGVRQNGTAAHTGAKIFGWVEYDSALSDAAILALYDYVYEHGELPTAGAFGCYNVGADVVGAAFPATLTDQVASADFSFFTGSASGITLVTREGLPSEIFAWAGVVHPVRDAWFAWGDSMTDGRGNIAEAPDGYEPLDGTLWMCKTVPSIVELVEPCGNAGGGAAAGVGPWGMCGWLIAQETGRQTVIVNGGVGGSRTDQWLPGQTNYNDALARIRHVCSQTNTTFRGFMIYIGPNDASFSATPPWLSNVQTILAAFRAALGKTAAQSPAVISRLTVDVPTDGAYTGWAHVQSEIDAIEDANHLLINTPPNDVDATREAFKLHHTAPENYVLAQQGIAALMTHASWT